jgi:sulfate transport system permease protein
MASPKSILPGYRAALAYTTLYLAIIVLIPLAGLFWKSAQLEPGEFFKLLTDERVRASLRLSFGTAMAAAVVNTGIGLLVAWALVRYTFPGKRLVDAVIDLPFALPTAVAGIALTALYAPNGFFGAPFEALGVKVAYTSLGITVALVFIGFPFVVRTVQPVLEDLDTEYEEAAACLGATRLQAFRRVVLPTLTPALLTGFTMAFARSIGEYGSVVFISGNMPFETEIAPLLIVTKLEQYDYAGATAIAVFMLIISLALLLTVNALQSWSRRYV